MRHLADLLVLACAFMLAVILRFDGIPEWSQLKKFLIMWPYVVVFQYGLLFVFGVTRFAWRYVGLREAARISLALGVAAVVFFVARLVSGELLERHVAARYALVPIGVIVFNYLLTFVGVTGVRVLRRLWAERVQTHRLRQGVTKHTKVLLIGAGRAGVVVAKELANRPDLGLQPVGFIDDDPHKLGTTIHGVRVLGRSSELGELVKRHKVEEVVITIASASGGTIRNLVKRCDEVSVPAKIIPGISEILDGKVNLSRIRQVSIEDLLGREAVHLDMELVAGLVTDRSVVVTGAGGSIGSELCRQLSRLGPREIVLVERAEPALFLIHREMTADYPSIESVPALCDVNDADRVAAVFERHKPHVVFHAAAHKHVPMMEWNPGEAVKNNVFGTRTVADAADRCGVGTFMLVSTDKAVNPTSIMGTSKRVAEIYLQALSARSNTKYVAVRFGNVLGSTGSVIPIFKDQIEAGGPVTVTHPDMKRYFMTIPEASQLVIQAGAMGKGGEIFVLDMGEPVRIVDLAHDLIKLSGFEPEVDINVEFVGVRPGEKLFEEFAFDAEQMDKTRHPKIYVGRLSPRPWDDVTHGLTSMAELGDAPTREQVRAALKALVPEMQADATSDEDAPAQAASEPQAQPAAPVAASLHVS